MKQIKTLFLLITIFFYPLAVVNAEVCTSPKKFFIKNDFSDWNQPENQDRISDTVWITRADQRGIFNIAAESAFSLTTSPFNTAWAFGSAADFQNLTFANWQTWHGGPSGGPPSTVGRDAVIHLIDQDIYLDIKFLSWSAGPQGGGGGGGGFSYERSVCSPIAIDVKVNNSDGPITISQAEALSVTVALNPDVQTGVNADWWVVATTPFGVFHYDLSSGTWLPGLVATFQGPLFNQPSIEVLNMTGLPAANYTFYFGFDTNMNGSLEMNDILFDSADVTIN